ncbi:hypothetical protein RAHE111665_12505 [Rariglobus hedericola]
MATFALEGCATKPSVAVMPPPAADFPVKVENITPRVPLQVTAAAQYVRITGAAPAAKGVLAFLGDEKGLRSGTIVLTRKQADAALEELVKVSGQEVKLLPTVTVAAGNAARMVIGPKLDGSDSEVPSVSINGQPFSARRDLSVELAISPGVSSDGLIQMSVDAQVTLFEGFVEYGDKTVTLLLGEKLGTPTEVKIPKGFYQPIFSTLSAKAEVRLTSGSVVVLCAERVEEPAPENLQGRDGKKMERIPAETMLVFLTAKTVAIKR